LCSIDGCGKPHTALGYCGAHHWRLKKHGDPLGSAPKEIRPEFCAVEDCTRERHTRAWCSAHYNRWRKYGDPLVGGPIKPVVPILVCTIEGCEKKHVARGWCHSHWTQWRVHGDPLRRINRPKIWRDGVCAVEDCDRRIANNGYCTTHYSRWRRHGHPQAEIPIIPKVLHGPVCAVADCDSKPVARGWCQRHWSRWRVHGDPLGAAPPGPTSEERFWAKVNKDGPGGCWLWTGRLDPAGYGQFVPKGGRPMKAHRYAYMTFVGPIPEARPLIDHRCRVRACVNPSHLRLATHAENSQNLTPRAGTKSGVRGVLQDAAGRWFGRAMRDGRGYNTPHFDTIEEAHEAVKALRRELFTHNDDDWAGIEGQLDFFGEAS
jgi:hypothetical protein